MTMFLDNVFKFIVIILLCALIFEDIKLEKTISNIQNSLNNIPTSDINAENKNELDDIQREENKIDSEIDNVQKYIPESLEEIYDAMAKSSQLGSIGDDISSIKSHLGI